MAVFIFSFSFIFYFSYMSVIVYPLKTMTLSRNDCLTLFINTGLGLNARVVSDDVVCMYIFEIS